MLNRPLVTLVVLALLILCGCQQQVAYHQFVHIPSAGWDKTDTLHFDIGRGLLHFEDVRCPRRGICKHEGVICKPRFRMQVPKEEGKVAVLYSRGLTADEIAGVLRKSIKTVKNQLESVRKRLHLDRTRDLIKIFSIYNGFTLWE